MPANDDALLARLNALKQSSVSFDTTSSASITPSKTSAPDDLAARFARLGSASPASSPKPSRTTSTNDPEGSGSAPITAPGASSYLEAVAEGIGGGLTEPNNEDEKSLEQLLAELGGKEQWDVSNTEEKDVSALLREIKSVLPALQKSVAEGQQRENNQEGINDWENVEVNVGTGTVSRQREDEGDHEDDGEKKRTEDEETDDVIARVMAELAMDKKYGDLDNQPNDSEPDESVNHKADPVHESTEHKHTDTGTPLSLPSAPSTLPQDDLAKTQAIEDALTARLAALSLPKPTKDSLGLPSAPSFSPAKKPPVIQQANVKKYTDEEIETWCIICNDDATLKCLGCEGDLYCRGCWMEGHRGEGAGYEERKHRAVEFVKGGGVEKQATAAG